MRYFLAILLVILCLLLLGFAIKNVEPVELQYYLGFRWKAPLSLMLLTSLLAGVIIGTPVMCGPGTITTVMILGAQDGILLTLGAVILALLCIWLILIFSAQIKKLLGETVLVILSKIVGLLLTAIAVHTIWTGILGLIALSIA